MKNAQTMADKLDKLLKEIKKEGFSVEFESSNGRVSEVNVVNHYQDLGEVVITLSE